MGFCLLRMLISLRFGEPCSSSSSRQQEQEQEQEQEQKAAAQQKQPHKQIRAYFRCSRTTLHRNCTTLHVIRGLSHFLAVHRPERGTCRVLRRRAG